MHKDTRIGIKWSSLALAQCALLCFTSIQLIPNVSLGDDSPEIDYNISEIAGELPVDKSPFSVGLKIYAKANAINLRAEPSPQGKYLQSLNEGDIAQILDLGDVSNDYVKVKVIAGSPEAMALPEAWVSLKLMTSNPNYEEVPQENSKYFVVQNIATERMRVYERCQDNNLCKHKLIMETEMVVGRPEEGRKDDQYAFVTMLGKGLISRWIKFHGNGDYPPWYSKADELGKGKLNIPPVGQISDWLIKQNGQSTVKGAFGWYKAELYPAAAVSQQWIHGTVGWGADAGEAIEATRGFWINMFANPGSHGCTRLENRAVAFLRSLLPVGTPVYRVYAREGLSFKPELKRKNWLSEYKQVNGEPGKWDWILTKTGAGTINGLAADAETVNSAQLPASEILEKGTFGYDQTPTAVGLDFRERPSSGKSGDRYELAKQKIANIQNFKGIYIVDEGRFLNYEHPITSDGRIRVGGLREFYKGSNLPDYMKYSSDQSGKIWMPEPKESEDPNQQYRRGG